jgi:hypothetical protein
VLGIEISVRFLPVIIGHHAFCIYSNQFAFAVFLAGKDGINCSGYILPAHHKQKSKIKFPLNLKNLNRIRSLNITGQ